MAGLLLVCMLAPLAWGAPLSPADSGFGGQTRSQNYDALVDAMYANGVVVTSIGDKMWVPWFSTSSSCTVNDLQRNCNSGQTIDFTHNCMVTDEFSQVGIIVSMGTNQQRMDQFYNTVLATKSTNGNIPAWRIYRDGSTIQPCRSGINGNCDTASDATARIIIALYTASDNANFDSAARAKYEAHANTLAKDFLTYEVDQTCRASSLGYGDICYWLAAGSNAKRGGMSSTDYGYTGYYADAIIAMLQACAQTGDRKYCTVADHFTLNYLQAANWNGATFSAPPGRSFKWTNLAGVPKAECTNTCAPVEWDGADAPRALGTCQALYYADLIGHSLPGLRAYCQQWGQKYMTSPTSAPIQYRPDGSALAYQSGYFAQGLEALFQIGGPNPSLFEPTLDSALGHYTVSKGTWDHAACFGIYTQAFPMRALGTGIGRDAASFPRLSGVQAPTCTPLTEVCDGKDNDCDGTVDESSVCAPACTPTGEVCDGKDNDCDGQVDENNICAPAPATCTPTAEVCDSKDNDCDGAVDEGNVCTTTQAGCFSNVGSMPVTCTGGTITQDAASGACRTIVCGDKQVLACDKPDGSAEYFEMYNQAGSAEITICLGSTCLADSGYAKSPSFPICTGTTETPSEPTPSEPVPEPTEPTVSEPEETILPEPTLESPTSTSGGGSTEPSSSYSGGDSGPKWSTKIGKAIKDYFGGTSTMPVSELVRQIRQHLDEEAIA